MSDRSGITGSQTGDAGPAGHAQARPADAVITGCRRGAAEVYLGVPYGRAGRFEASEVMQPEGGISALGHGPMAPQIEWPEAEWNGRRPSLRQDEACLNLDIYTPAADGGRRPVVVHVFGGGFETGSSVSAPIDGVGFATAGDVVLVRPNLRTGVLGYLHLGDHFPELEGANRGLLDLVTVLQWVRDNIGAFGGDAQNVTVMGMSSGAFTTTALLALPQAQGLFRRAWMMSGNASRTVSRKTAAGICEDFLRRTGVAPGDTEALRALPVAAILSAQRRMFPAHLAERNCPGGRRLGIVIDGTSMAREPMAALREGAARSKPLMLTTTRDEARFWYALGMMPKVDAARLRETVRLYEGARADDVLRNWYPQESLARREEMFLSDRIYQRPAHETAAAQRAAGGAAGESRFDWVPPAPHGDYGAAHGFDEAFRFSLHDPALFPLAAADPEAPALARRLEAEVFAFLRS